jgi:hypothetical protein
VNSEAFLERFFGQGNDIDRASIEHTPELQALIEPVTSGLTVPAVLPRRHGRVVDWFVICRDDTILRATQGEVQAFIGPSYARWDGVRATLDEHDPVERALLEFAGPRVLRFQTKSDMEFRDCWAAVRLMRSVWSQRPRPEPEFARTGAALVNEFELAIAGGDTSVAYDAFVELRGRGLLGSENLRFLEIRMLAADRRWPELASAPDIEDLARLRRPWLVTEDLLTALYRVRILFHEEAGDVPAAIAATSALVDQLPGLFTSRGPLRSADVLKLFGLRYALPDRADPLRVRESIDERVLSTPERRWLEAIADSLAGAPPPTPSAHDALLAGDLDAAFTLAQAERPGPASVEVLIACADELQTLDSAEGVLAAIDELTDDDRDALLTRRMISSAVERLRALAAPSDVSEAPAVPHTWTSWLERLLVQPEWSNAQAVASCGELEYSASDLADPASADALPGLVEQVADSPRRRALQDALPQIVRWLDRQQLDPRLARPMHDAILTAVAFGSDRSRSTLDTAYNATESLLTVGVDDADYADILDKLEELWKRTLAPASVPWLCDLLELLWLNPGPREQLIAFAVTTLEPVLRLADQLSRGLLENLGQTLAALGAEELAAQLIGASGEAVETMVDDTVLAGRLVGIYTLTPQVAIRAREGIERQFPGVRVQIDSSQDSTDSLEHLAATADYLIVSLRSAKHAATDAIDRRRPRDLPTLIPRGRGSSRMVEALIDAVQSTPRSIAAA